jgi:myo-inositol-1(or 4)-monophosphatase
MIDIERISELARQWAKEAGRISVERTKHPLTVFCKTGPSDLVTLVDEEIEKFFSDKILAAFPQHGILGEEGVNKLNPEDFKTVWIIDPIDGTTNYVHQQVNYVISIAVVHQGESLLGIVYDPTRNELFFAQKDKGAFLNGKQLTLQTAASLEESLICTNLIWSTRTEKFGLKDVLRELPLRCRGIRMYGCAALELAYVAAGRVDAYLSLFLNSWDFAAGRLLIQEAGGKITTLQGDDLPIFSKSSVLASNVGVHPDLLSLLQGEPE